MCCMLPILITFRNLFAKIGKTMLITKQMLSFSCHFAFSFHSFSHFLGKMYLCKKKKDDTDSRQRKHQNRLVLGA